MKEKKPWWALLIPVVCGILGVVLDKCIFNMHRAEQIATKGIAVGHAMPVLTIILPAAGFVVFFIILIIYRMNNRK